ncbi:MAG: DUF1330 domain-containing protein [Pseudomonadota bacterium]
MNPAYLIGNITIKDSEKWSEYRDKIPATLVTWGGKLVFRGKKVDTLGGEHKHIDNVIIQFPDIDALNNWFNSPEYQQLIPIRKLAADVDLVSYQAEN